MGSGRTKPALFGCEDKDGNGSGEFVVKFKGGLETGVDGLTCELISSLVADDLGIASPSPALIEIDAAIARFIPESDADVATVIRKSEGANFGTQVLVGGFPTWPTDKAIPAGLLQAATEVFAFDALIQNPDRRYDNPNLLWRDEEVFVIDHDSAFSFLYALGNQSSPWNLERAHFLEQHVFYRPLKGRFTEVERFMGALEAMSDDKISNIAEAVPLEWRTDKLPRIVRHLKLLRDHARDFAEQVKRRLV
ncbi:MAG TPA: HipA family kinase [Terriglobia bacterium]|nr:HipA family kinase [Terriglobia bacterium]